MSKTVKQASDYLRRHRLEKVYSSSDGYLFEKKQDALAHAKTLEDKNVKTHYLGKTANVQGEKQLVEILPNSSKKAKDQKDQDKTEKPKGTTKSEDTDLPKNKNKPQKETTL